MLSAVTNLSDRTKYIAAIVLIAAVTIFVLWGFAASKRAEAERHAADVRALTSVASERTQLALNAEQRAEQALKERDTALAQAEKLRKVYAATPRPSKPEDPPAEDAALAAQLQEAGMAQAPPLRADAVLVWNWRQAAIQVPQWEARANACDDLVKGLEIKSQAQDKALAEMTQAKDGWKLTADTQQSQTILLQQEVKALHSAATATKYRNYLLIGGALAAGYLAGRGR